MNSNQTYIYGQIEKQVQDYLFNYQTKLMAVDHLKFFPKKDGNEKANFALNFGFEEGETYTIHWRHDEKQRYVKIELKEGYYRPQESNVARLLEFKTAPIWDDPNNRQKQVVPFTEHSIWLDTDKYRKYYKKEMQTAKEIFNLIKNEYRNDLLEQIEYHKKELEDLPENFKILCNAATEFNMVRNKLTGTLGSYAYRLQGRDFQFFINQED